MRGGDPPAETVAVRRHLRNYFPKGEQLKSTGSDHRRFGWKILSRIVKTGCKFDSIAARSRKFTFHFSDAYVQQCRVLPYYRKTVAMLLISKRETGPSIFPMPVYINAVCSHTSARARVFTKICEIWWKFVEIRKTAALRASMGAHAIDVPGAAKSSEK